MIKFVSFCTAMAIAACGCEAETIATSSNAKRTREMQPMTPPSSEKVEVWVVLTEPPVSTSPKGQIEKIKRQQDAAMAQLKLLGAIELARVSLSNNALAVTIESARLPEVKRMTGVRSVSPVKHIEREPVPGPAPTR